MNDAERHHPGWWTRGRSFRRGLLGVFLLACAVQLAVPAVMIARAERTQVDGALFRFRCAPVDPMDPIRGRYVSLAFDAESERVPMDASLGHDDQAFAVIGVDGDGFARIVRITTSRNADATTVPITVRAPRDGTASVDLPFDRYFLNERLAPETERAYREALRERNVTVWAEVRILDGAATLTGLSIDGMPAEDYVRAARPR